VNEQTKAFALYTGDDERDIGASVFNCFVHKCFPNDENDPIIYKFLSYAHDPDFCLEDELAKISVVTGKMYEISCSQKSIYPRVPRDKETVASQIYTAPFLLEAILLDKLNMDYSKFRLLEYSCPPRLWMVFYLVTQLKEEMILDRKLKKLGKEVRDLLQNYVLENTMLRNDEILADDLEKIIQKLGTILLYGNL